MKTSIKILTIIIVIAIIITGWFVYYKVKQENNHNIQYDLPLDLGKVSNLKICEKFIEMNDNQKDFLKKNGFVGIKNHDIKYSSFLQVYEEIDNKPIFVTTDSILHMYHVYYDNYLQSVEEKYLINLSRDMTNGMLKIAETHYQNVVNGIKDLAKKNVAYFSIALKLIDPTASIPSYVENEVNTEISRITTHQGISSSIIFDYEEDYSQYKPRGHYTESINLERYFKLMMWYGRMNFRINNDDETIRAIMICTGMQKDQGIFEDWKKIYEVTKYFIGYPDDLTIKDYGEVINNVYGILNSDFNELEDNSKLSLVKTELEKLRKPKICSSIIYFGEEFTNVTHGFRFMGQRFIPDSYIFQELIYDRVSTLDDPRFFPKGLDVMAVLGSEEAKTLLEPEKKYLNYEKQMNNLIEEFSEYNKTIWTQNLYWGWLYSLKSLTIDFSNDNYPTFMQQRSWQDKELNTILASWTELRHDTILYGKQSYPPCGISPELKGYVEPVPEFYSRLKDLTQKTIILLRETSMVIKSIEDSLIQFKNVLEKLETISIKELKNEELNDEEYEYIRDIGHHLSTTGSIYTSDDLKTTVVADVHTDPNSFKCLEEGVGYIDFIIVIVKRPDGTLSATIGPIFSYYEFKQPISSRLTDEEWRDMLDKGNKPDRPDWKKLFAP